MSLQNGTFLGPVISAPFITFAGIIIRFPDMPGYLHWLSYFSYMRYGVISYVQAVYGFDRELLDCPDRYCHFRYPRKILKEMDMESWYWWNTSALVSFAIGFRILAYLGLKHRLRKNK